MHLHTRCLDGFFFFFTQKLEQSPTKDPWWKSMDKYEQSCIAALLTEQALRNPTNILYAHFLRTWGGGGISHQVCPVTNRRITEVAGQHPHAANSIDRNRICLIDASVSARSTPLVSAQSSACCHLDWPHGVCYAKIILCVPTFKRGAAKVSGDTRLSAKFANMVTEKIERNHNNPAEILRKSACSTAISSTILHCSTRSLRKKTQSWTFLKLPLLERHCTAQLAFYFGSRQTVHYLRVGVVASWLAMTSQPSPWLAQSTRYAARACWYWSTARWHFDENEGVQAFNVLFHGIPKQAWAANVSQGIPRRSLLRR